MSQCLPWSCLPCVWECTGFFQACGARRRRISTGASDHISGAIGVNAAGNTGPDHDALLEVLRLFRKDGHRMAQVAAGGKEAVSLAGPLVEAACQLVEALVLGIRAHLPELRAEARREWDGRNSHEASFSVRFIAPAAVIGEIVTRSRVALSVRVAGELHFALRLPQPLTEQTPLVLRVDGLEMPALPDAVRARTQLRAELGDRLDPMSAYAWWELHRHSEFPLPESKFHRVVESLLEQRALKMLGTKVRADSFWGYLHTTDLCIECFEFLLDRRLRGGISVTALERPPRSSIEAEDRAKVSEITQRILRNNRPSADRVAPSAINVGAMLSGTKLGQPGASPAVVAKLLSHARWWGPGDDGWHRHDETWLCTDRKNNLGQAVEQQGRIIWRLEGTAPGAAPAPQPPCQREARCSRPKPVLFGRLSRLRHRAAARLRTGTLKPALTLGKAPAGKVGAAPRRGIAALAALARGPHRPSCWPRNDTKRGLPEAVALP